MMEPPKFTQPLTDRTTTRGYSTHLFCSVRGFPQVGASSTEHNFGLGTPVGFFAKWLEVSGRWLVLLD